jgi:hypothetical protein
MAPTFPSIKTGRSQPVSYSWTNGQSCLASNQKPFGPVRFGSRPLSVLG